MAPTALIRFLHLLRRRLGQCRRSRMNAPDLQCQFQPATTTSEIGGGELLDSFLDNEYAMKSYAEEINLDRIRSLSSEDRRAIALRRSAMSNLGSPQNTLPSLTPRQPRIERLS
ncbi:hypothetical protein ON010_g1334 [Phytophthora cinnamomi]|nr:hypothetical protein ON010_g1334 [Phytophthora cinnamomi]